MAYKNGNYPIKSFMDTSKKAICIEPLEFRGYYGQQTFRLGDICDIRYIPASMDNPAIYSINGGCGYIAFNECEEEGSENSKVITTHFIPVSKDNAQDKVKETIKTEKRRKIVGDLFIAFLAEAGYRSGSTMNEVLAVVKECIKKNEKK